MLPLNYPHNVASCGNYRKLTPIYGRDIAPTSLLIEDETRCVITEAVLWRAWSQVMKADGFVLAYVSICCFFSHSEWRDGQAGLQLLPGPRGTGARQTHWHWLQVDRLSTPDTWMQFCLKKLMGQLWCHAVLIV